MDKMSQEKQNLTWQTYSDTFVEMMTGLVENESFSDVTLICEDSKQIKAHRTMLSICSPVLKDIFHSDSGLPCTIFLNGVYFSELESVMKFLYYGEEAFNLENLNNILSVAKSLEFKELCDKIEFHIELISKQEQNYACNECEYQTPHPGGLKNHISVYHQGIRHKCNECEKEFSIKGALSRHYKSVHEVIRHSCNECDTQFTQRFSLKEHIQSVHEGLRYECQQCNFQATQKGLLKRHIRLKHENVSIECSNSNCNATFISIIGRKRHMMKVGH